MQPEYFLRIIPGRLIRFLIFIYLIFSFSLALHAQTDTTIVDTVSFSKIDSLTQPDNDAYADTMQKHIYDTSQYFFNWKNDYRQLFKKEKTGALNLIDADVKALKAEKDFWYVTAVEKLEARLKTDPAYRDSLTKANLRGINDGAQKDFRQQTWFQFLIWFIIIATFLGAVFYFLLQHKINLFVPPSASAAQNDNEEMHENIFKLSYAQLLRNAEQEQDYRVGIRLLFLQTIKILSETKYIQYQPDYTNLHYLQQLHQSKLYNEFSLLIRSYEYVWYGKFELSHERYTSIKNSFLMFQHKIT